MTPSLHAMNRVLLVGGIVLALSGCGALEATLKSEGVLAPQDGGTVVMRNGAPLVVSLSPDPATGYGWVLRSTGPNLMPIGIPDYMQDPKPPGMLGVAGATTFRFRAKSPGTSTIEFAWQAPPGAPPAPEKVVRYEVTVTPTRWYGVL
jgi:inhibitor of cysteine peptidase